MAYGSGPMPQLVAGTAIIRILRVGICGTDLHAYQGTQPYFSYPRILGHELSGELVAVDGATSFAPGDPVTVLPYFHCGACVACRQGKPNCCVHLQVCGVHCDGGMRQYLRVPATALVQGRELTLDELALVEPFAIGAHSIRRAHIQPGEQVLVMGAGPIGLAVMAMARQAGASVIALDINPTRLQFCATHLGVPHRLLADAGNIADQLAALTQGDMPAVVFDATGNRHAIQEGFRYLAHGGRYVLVGLQQEAVSFHHPEFHKREATLMSSRNATRADFEQVMEGIRNKTLRPLDLVTHRVAFGDAGTVFPSFLLPGSEVIKALIVMPG